MANTEHNDGKVTSFVELQESEALNKKEAGFKEEATDQPANHEEEDKEATKKEKFKLIPREWWYSDKNRDKFFFSLHLRLAYLQRYLPLFEVVEMVPQYAKHYKGPSRKEIERLMQHYLPTKRDDPGSFSLEIIFANKQTAKGLIDIGTSCNVMPYSIYKKIGVEELQPSKANLKMADKS